MPYRNIFVANESRLKLSDNQLTVSGISKYSFPLEDIRCVLIENEKSVLSVKLISALAEYGVCLITCDGKHLPCAVLLPINQYCRMNKRINLQLNQSVPKLKRIWQSIVIRKIENQSSCLRLNGIDNADKIMNISKSVLSGDTSNREGYSANIYFKSLFGKDFKRDSENLINAALNYGYSILRSYIAKCIVSYGLEPSIGIFHKNQLNAFNLADDIIEPFRPVIDLFVFQNHKDWNNTFSTAEKASLVKLINAVVTVNKEHNSVANAIETMIQSIIACFESEKFTEIKMPELVKTDFFEYE